MENKEITVHFNYNAQPQESLVCKSNETIENVCRAIASKKNLNFDSVYFLLKGNNLDESQYQKPVSDFLGKLSEGNLYILLYDKVNQEDQNEENRPNKKVEVCFWLNGEVIKVDCFMDSNMLDISRIGANMLERDFEKLIFKYGNNNLNFKKTFEETASQFDKNKGKIEIKVEEKQIEKNKEVQICFWFQGKPTNIDCFTNSKMLDICRLYAIRIGRNFNKLNFKYQDEKIDFSKDFSVIATMNDINKGLINIIVDEINVGQINNNNQNEQVSRSILRVVPFQKTQPLQQIQSVQGNQLVQMNQSVNKSQSFFPNQLIPRNQSVIPVSIPSNDRRYMLRQEPTRVNIQNPQNNNRDNDSLNRWIDLSCFKYCSKTKWIIGIIVGLVIIVILVLLIIYETKTEDSNSTTESNSGSDKDRCEQYNSSSKTECIKCKEGFDLYKGICLLYTFYAKYQTNYHNENIQLLNPDKIDNLIAIKINGKTLEPNTELSFDIIGNNPIYFYLNENTSISLSYLFKNNEELIFFKFNSDSMDNFDIIDIKSMFNGCINLKEVYFESFKGQKIKDISELFSNCISLYNFNLTIMDISNIKYMNKLFYNCQSITKIQYPDFIDKNVINISSMFYNCSSLTSLKFSDINTQNVVDMSYMFYNCISLTSLDLSKFQTQNVNNMEAMFYNCYSLTSLDLSNFSNHIELNLEEMFYGCRSLKYIDFSSFITEKNTSVFSQLPNDCTIKINKLSSDKINTIPYSCNIILNDN